MKNILKGLLLLALFLHAHVVFAQILDTAKVDSMIILAANKATTQPDTALALLAQLDGSPIIEESPRRQFTFHNTKGIAMQYVGLLDSGLVHQRMALKAGLTASDTFMIISSMNNMAALFYRSGRPDSSAYYRFKVYELAKQGKNKQMIVHAIFGLALNHQRVSEYNKAIRGYKECLSYIEADDSLAKADVFANLGIVHKDLKQLDSAEYYLRSSLENNPNKVSAKVTLASVQSGRERYEEAISTIRSAIDQLVKMNNQYGLAASYCNLGIFLTEAGRPEEALAYLEIADSIATSISAHVFILNTLSAKVEARIRAKDTDQAVEAYNNYIDFRDSLDASALEEKTQALETEFETKLKEEEIKSLEQENELQELRIQREKTVRSIFGVAALLSLVIAGFIVFFYTRLRKLNAQLKGLNDTKNKFFAIIAHDLKGAISSFTGIGPIIKNHLTKGRTERAIAVADETERGAEHLDGLLHNLLNWSFTQLDTVPYQPEKVKVREVTQHVLKDVDSRAESKKVNIIVQGSDQGEAYADPNALQFILRNLVSNAIKYSKQGGSIEINHAEQGNEFKLEVVDYGVGMNQEEQARLFVIGNKVSKKGTSGERGSGLGLILCKEFTELNKGTLSLKSKEGEGTAVTILLPKN